MGLSTGVRLKRGIPDTCYLLGSSLYHLRLYHVMRDRGVGFMAFFVVVSRGFLRLRHPTR